jgi:hypothetical protein
MIWAEIEKLQATDAQTLLALNEKTACQRIRWFDENRHTFDFITEDLVFSAYRLLLYKLKIAQCEAPIVFRSVDKIVFHSKNFCPTLEACKILGLDTREICPKLNENATDALIKQLSPRLKFMRNYAHLRPYTDYCEEMILLE